MNINKSKLINVISDAMNKNRILAIWSAFMSFVITTVLTLPFYDDDVNLSDNDLYKTIGIALGVYVIVALTIAVMNGFTKKMMAKEILKEKELELQEIKIVNDALIRLQKEKVKIKIISGIAELNILTTRYKLEEDESLLEDISLQEQLFRDLHLEFDDEDFLSSYISKNIKDEAIPVPKY